MSKRQSNTYPVNTSATGLKAVAVFEASKGLVVILAGIGLLVFVHHDAQAFAERLVSDFHLNPARHYPKVFIDAAGRLTDANLWILAAGAFAYSTLRFTEAYGLWRARAWGEWMGIVSCGVYLPVEALELFRRPTLIKMVLLVLNLVLVTYLSYRRYRYPRRDGREQRPTIEFKS